MCTIVYMTVNYFRTHLKEHFDAALAGGTVQVERGGIVYRLIAEIPQLKKVELRTTGEGTASERSRYVEVPLPDRFDKPLCKIHALPLDARGRCLQKGCKYA